MLRVRFRIARARQVVQMVLWVPQVSRLHVLGCAAVGVDIHGSAPLLPTRAPDENFRRLETGATYRSFTSVPTRTVPDGPTPILRERCKTDEQAGMIARATPLRTQT